MKNIIIAAIVVIITSIAASASTQWPRTFKCASGTVVMYQPELEKFENTILEARAAVSVRRKSDTAAIYGAVWLECTMDIDRTNRTAALRSVKVKNARFPESMGNTDGLRAEVEEALKRDATPMPLDELVAAMDNVRARNEQSAQFRNEAPPVVVATKPTVLVIIDGDPRWTDISGSSVERVENTPYMITRVKGRKDLFLYAGQYWYTTQDVAGSWSATNAIPKEIQVLAPQYDEQIKKNNNGKMPEKAKSPATIVVKTQPSELIQFDGEPSYDPISGTQLMAASNCSTLVFMDIASQMTYVVLGGRWYKTSDLKKQPYGFVPSDALPADFAKVPEGSKYDEVLAYVAGTNAAREAVLDASIPQTAAVDRAKTTCTVTYNGNPEFKAIEGTSMKFAVNTSSSVLLINNRYHCCDNGVWFESDKATGPWVVSTKRPPEVDNIPASSPVYNVKYVYVYETTPTTVYVGYTPGYMGSYVMGPTVVYGTGYWYRPYGPYYYPYHMTYGFHMAYSPYGGWSCGIHVGFGYGGGYWGPPMYRPPYYYRPPYGYYGRGGYQPQRGYSRAPGMNRPSNVYGQGGSGAGANRPGVQPARPSQLPSNMGRSRPSTNNVMTDRSGNVYRPSNGGFDRSNGSSWSRDKSAPSRDLMNTQSQRNRGQMRSSNMNAGARPSGARPSGARPSGARPSGGMRGGGRR